MISKSRVDRSKFQVTLIPKGMNFLGNFFLLQSPSMKESGSDMHQDFALSSFNNQVGIYFWKKFIKSFTSKLAIMNRAFLFGYSRFTLLMIICTTKFITNPIHNIFISIRNFDVSMVIKNWFRCELRFGMKKADEKASFPIYESCEICKFCISHKTPLFKTIQYAIDPNICTA